MIKINETLTLEIRFEKLKQGDGSRILAGFLQEVEDLYNTKYKSVGLIKLIDGTTTDEAGKKSVYLFG